MEGVNGCHFVFRPSESLRKRTERKTFRRIPLGGMRQEIRNGKGRPGEVGPGLWLTRGTDRRRRIDDLMRLCHIRLGPIQRSRSERRLS